MFMWWCQAEIHELVMAGQNVFFTGNAGTGTHCRSPCMLDWQISCATQCSFNIMRLVVWLLGSMRHMTKQSALLLHPQLAASAHAMLIWSAFLSQIGDL